MVIEVNGLTKHFGSRVAVDNLSFEVKEGEVFALLGPNGAGKTTTVRMLACLLSPSEGSAMVKGYNITKDQLKIRASIGLLTENPSLYERLTAYENMEFFAEAYGITTTEDRRIRMKELFEFFELWDRRNDKVASYSKGMKQKLAIARALVHNPPILFLDEPTSGLDPEASKGIRDLIERLSRLEKRTIMLCTHRLEDAERLCNRVMIINSGRKIIVGSVDDLRERIGGHPLLQVTLKKVERRVIEAINTLRGVKRVEVDPSKTTLTITVEDYNSNTPEVVRCIVNEGGEILAVNSIRPSLEEAYLKLVRGAEN